MINKTSKKPGLLRLLPTYTELSLFLMLFGTFLTIISNFEIIKSSYFLSELFKNLWPASLIIIYSIILTLYYVFNFKKTPGIKARTYMIFLAFILEFVAAIMLFTYSVESLSAATFSSTIYAVLGLFNFLQAIILIMLIKLNIVNESNIIPRNAKPEEIVIGLSSALIIFLIIDCALQLEYPVVFSLMITYAVFFNNIVSSLFPKYSLKR